MNNLLSSLAAQGGLGGFGGVTQYISHYFNILFYSLKYLSRSKLVKWNSMGAKSNQCAERESSGSHKMLRA